MTSPMPFLATMTGASAGLFSIVAGFLVSRFVGLDSEQQTNERELDELNDELAIARKRVEKARASWIGFEAELVFEDHEVLDAVYSGTIDAETLRRRCPTPLPDAELQDVARKVRRHYESAFTTLNTLIGSLPDIESASVLQLEELNDWYALKAATQAVPADPEWPDVWEHALGKVMAPRIAEAEEREARRRESEFGGLVSNLPLPTLNLPVMRGRSASDISRRRAELETSLSRAELRVEDLEAEIGRIRRRWVVMPIKELIRALGILTTLGVLGVLIPLFVMSTGPEEHTPEIKSLHWTFLFAFLLLLGYLASFAARLRRKVKKLTGHEPQKEAPAQPGPETGDGRAAPGTTKS